MELWRLSFKPCVTQMNNNLFLNDLILHVKVWDRTKTLIILKEIHVISQIALS